MTRASIRAVQPVLACGDVQVSVAWYVERLGFTLVFLDAPANPRYAAIRRDDVELHLQWSDPAEWGTGDRPMYRFFVPRVDDLFEEFRTRGVYHDRTALRDTPWGTREFAFYDPDRNGLTFYRPIA